MTPTRIIAAFALLALSACPPPPHKPTSRYVFTVEQDTDKAVTIESDPAFAEHEPTPLSPEFVRRAFMASSFFKAEELETLAPAIADVLPQMESDEQVRIVAWEANEPRMYFIYTSGGKLRMRFERGPHVIATHEATIPAETVALEAPPEDTPPDPPPSPKVEPNDTSPGPTAVAVKPPSKKNIRKRQKIRRRSKRVAARPRLTESEARKKLGDLSRLLERELVSKAEYKSKRRDILERL